MANSVLDWVWDHSCSRHAARLVLLSLADSTNKPGGWTWPSVTELTRRTGLGARAVQAAIIELARMGELTVEYNAGPKGCNRYKVSMATPAKSAGAQKLRGAETAPPQNLRGSESPQVKGATPAKSAPPANFAPPQNATPTPANFADGTVREPTTEPTPTELARKSAKHATADDLAAAFWERHKGATAQTFLAVRQVIRTAIANGIARNDVARALDVLAKEGRAISGGTITTAIAQIRHPNGTRPGATPLVGVSPRDEHRYRR